MLIIQFYGFPLLPINCTTHNILIAFLIFFFLSQCSTMLTKVIMNMHFSFHVQIHHRVLYVWWEKKMKWMIAKLNRWEKQSEEEEEKKFEERHSARETHNKYMYHNPFYIALQICFKHSAVVLLFILIYMMLLCISKDMFCLYVCMYVYNIFLWAYTFYDASV